MSAATHQVRASFAFVERNWNLVRRYWAWEIVWLAYSIANSLAVSYIGLGMGVLTDSDAIKHCRPFLYYRLHTMYWRALEPHC